MSEINKALINQFYTAFQNGDFKTMGACYHDEATFKDEAFDLKTAEEVRKMWEMLISRGKDMKISFKDVNADESSGSAHWEADYVLSKTGNKVHNIIEARFKFKDGLIVQHVDSFNFYAWSKQAFGWTGFFLGGTGFFHNKVQNTAMGGLHDYIAKGKAKASL